jgi:starvation-inducible DNA-binding protein
MNDLSQLQQFAKISFASTYSFAIKSQNFHWNVIGSDFFEYHSLFEKIYQEVYESIDNFAENIRKLKAYTPASLSRFSMLTKIEDETEILPVEAMVKELLDDNDRMLVILKKTYDAAEAAGKHGFSNFLAERMDAHEKHGWMLRASSKGQQL